MTRAERYWLIRAYCGDKAALDVLRGTRYPYLREIVDPYRLST